jgi:hypothetical protein
MDEDDRLGGSVSDSQNLTSNEHQLPIAHRTQPLRHAIWLVLLLLLLVNVTNGISNLPLNRLLERRLCRTYYDTDHDVDEELCKVDRIQQDLAWIMGVFETLWIVGGKWDAKASLSMYLLEQ